MFGRNHDVEIGTGKSVHDRDWVCMDCGIVYCEDEDATEWDLPTFCPECGDTPGWENRKTGRKVP
jgi:hypothetical protein